MTDKKLVKVTVESGGEVKVYEREAAMVVAFDDIDGLVSVDTRIAGYTSLRLVARALASSVDSIDLDHDGFIDDLMNGLILKTLERVVQAVDCDEE